jgi:DNA-binding XRE family transcriptional regulator
MIGISYFRLFIVVNCVPCFKAAILTRVPKAEFTQADAVFRELLKELRRTQNVTQVQLARRLGRPQSYVSKFENGDRRLDFVETAFLCDALGLKLENVARIFTRRLTAARRAKGRETAGGGT